jgi:NitT/TauT family transport system permease protein
MKRIPFEPVLVLLVGLGLWEAAADLAWIPAFLFPAPSEIAGTLMRDAGEFETATLQTLYGTLAGFGLSLIFGTCVAMVFSLSGFLKRAFLPFAVFFQTVPIIAIAPLLVIYFGFGLPTVVASSFIVSLFPILANTLLGLESADPGLIEMFQLYRARPSQLLLKLKLPGAYPLMYAGWKIGIGLAIIGAIAGEFVAGGGLGALIDASRTQQRIDRVYAALLVLTMLGMLLVGLIRLGHVLLQKHRPYGLQIKEEG